MVQEDLNHHQIVQGSFFLLDPMLESSFSTLRKLSHIHTFCKNPRTICIGEWEKNQTS